MKVRGSMSAKTGMAPARRMALALAKKLKGVVTTTSGAEEGTRLPVLLPMPRAASASQSASVPLAHPTEERAEHAAAAEDSK